MIFPLAMIKDHIENQGYVISNCHLSSESPTILFFTLLGKNGEIRLDTDDPNIINYVYANRKRS